MGLFRKTKADPETHERSFDSSFGFGGQSYALQQTLTSQGPIERPQGYAENVYAYRGNSIIYACMSVRSLLFSEARFQWRQFDKGRPG